MELNQREILRYLGYKQKDTPDAGTMELVEDVSAELLRVCEPKSVFRIFPIREVREDAIDFGFVQLKSRNLAKNLKGCHSAAFLAATLGNSVEFLMQKYNRLQVSRAIVLQAAAAEAIEQYCDACEDEIRREVGPDAHLRPRFSPGYGDFPLEFQKEFLQILEASKKIGLTLTDSMLMMPSKSVTAVIGISREETNCHRQGCEVCDKTDCPYRRG